MTLKEELLDYCDDPPLVGGRNSMGCDENWYSAFFAMKECFSREEIEAMSEREVELCVRVAEAIQEALY